MDLQPRCLLISNCCTHCQELIAIFNFLNIPIVQTTSAKILPLRENAACYQLVILCAATAEQALQRITETIQYLPTLPKILLGNFPGKKISPAITQTLAVPLHYKTLQEVITRYNLSPTTAITLNKNTFASLQQWVGSSTTMQELKNTMIDASKGQSTLFLAGENGTEQELIAQTIHQLSTRQHFPFIPVNCRSIPTELIESELLGNEPGALTGSTFQHVGRFEFASNGTLFLEGVDGLPLALQKKLSEILQQRTFKRVGGSRVHYLNARIIATAKINPTPEYHKKLHNLLQRCVINLPPLRDYLSDLPELIDYFIAHIKGKNHEGIRFTKNALMVLSRYHWPGNRTELRSLLENLILCSHNPVIDVNDLPEKFSLERTVLPLKEYFTFDHIPLPINTSFSLKEYLLALEFSVIKQTAEKFNGNISRTAKYLNIGRTTLIEKIRKHHVGKTMTDDSALEDTDWNQLLAEPEKDLS